MMTQFQEKVRAWMKVYKTSREIADALYVSEPSVSKAMDVVDATAPVTQQEIDAASVMTQILQSPRKHE